MTQNNNKYYQDKFGNVYGNTIELPVGRLIYRNLEKVSEYSGKFEATILIPKVASPSFPEKLMDYNKGVFKKIVEENRALIAAHAKASKVKLNPLAFLKDGDTKTDKEGNPIEALKGCYYMVVKANPDAYTKKTLVLQKTGENNSVVVATADEFVPGVLVRVIGSFLVSAIRPGQEAIGARMRRLQLLRDDGTRYSNGGVSKEMERTDAVNDILDGLFGAGSGGVSVDEAHEEDDLIPF